MIGTQPISNLIGKARARTSKLLRRDSRGSETQWYQDVSRLGCRSDNPWIQKSAEIDGVLFEGEHEFLWDLAISEKRGDILEIGTWMGKSACILAGACKQAAPNTATICVDTFEMSGTEQQVRLHSQLVPTSRTTFPQFIENARRLGFRDSVILMADVSSRILPLLSCELRLAFIDGAHDYENVKGDVECVYPRVRSGGVVLLHDVLGPAYPELSRYYREELQKDPRFIVIGERGTMVALRKR